MATLSVFALLTAVFLPDTVGCPGLACPHTHTHTHTQPKISAFGWRSSSTQMWPAQIGEESMTHKQSMFDRGSIFTLVLSPFLAHFASFFVLLFLQTTSVFLAVSVIVDKKKPQKNQSLDALLLSDIINLPSSMRSGLFSAWITFLV